VKELLNNKIALVGGGVMGRGIAQLAAQCGFSPTLFNRSEASKSRSKDLIKQKLTNASQKGRLNEGIDQVFDRIFFSCDLDEVLSEADLVIESLPENKELKCQMFQIITKKAPSHCVLATNTSSLSVSDIAIASGAPERFCGMHFFNPPIAMTLLELVTHKNLDDKILQWVVKMAEALNRDAIHVADVPGFATSRLSVCIGLEAIRMVEQGVACAADIDKAMELGYRHPMGPLKLGDYIGLDVRLKVAEHLYQELKTETFNPPELLRKMVAEGKTGKKSGQGFYAW